MRGFWFLSSLKSDPRENLRPNTCRPVADETKLPVACEKKPLVPRVPHSINNWKKRQTPSFDKDSVMAWVY